MKLTNLLFIFLLFIVISCKKKEVGPQDNSNNKLPGTFDNGMFILNEGNFGTNNASISFLNFEKQEITNNVFQGANEDKKLGDVAHSMSIIGNSAYVVVNNSQKILKLNLKNFKVDMEMTKFNSPRYILQTGVDKAYVTNFTLGSGSNPIKIIRLSDGEVIGSILMNGWSERMIMIDNKVFVANMTEGKIYVINATTDAEIKRIEVNEEPNSMVLDKNGDLWVLCSGGFKKQSPALYKIDPEDLTITRKTSPFLLSESPSNLVINDNGDYLYFLNNGVYKAPIDYDQLPKEPLIDLKDFQYPYGLMVYGISNEIFVTDAKDFQQSGSLFHYNSTGILLKEYQVGEGPSFMLVNK